MLLLKTYAATADLCYYSRHMLLSKTYATTQDLCYCSRHMLLLKTHVWLTVTHEDVMVRGVASDLCEWTHVLHVAIRSSPARGLLIGSASLTVGLRMIIATYYSLLTTYYSLLTTHYLLLTT